MKRTAKKGLSTKGKKLDLNLKTIRILNETELKLVNGGDELPTTSPQGGGGGCGG